MPPDLIPPDEVDTRMGWTPGRAERLARRGRLPHYSLPDGGVRFDWVELSALVRHVTPSVGTDGPAGKAVADGR